MHDDRRKPTLLLDESKSFIPNQPDLQTLSFASDGMPENWENSLVRIELPGTESQESTEEPAAPEATSETPAPEPAADPEPAPAPAYAPQLQSTLRPEP